ncbi:hypothetical protein L9F63_013307, partial [Diploptera punctata]
KKIEKRKPYTRNQDLKRNNDLNKKTFESSGSSPKHEIANSSMPLKREVRPGTLSNN